MKIKSRIEIVLLSVGLVLAGCGTKEARQAGTGQEREMAIL